MSIISLFVGLTPEPQTAQQEEKNDLTSEPLGEASEIKNRGNPPDETQVCAGVVAFM